MPQNLEIPDPIFDALQQAASASGTTPVGWIAAHLPNQVDSKSVEAAKTLADLFAGHIGGFKSGSNVPLSQNCGEIFADYLEEKRREGRL